MTHQQNKHFNSYKEGLDLEFLRAYCMEHGERRTFLRGETLEEAGELHLITTFTVFWPSFTMADGGGGTLLGLDYCPVQPHDGLKVLPRLYSLIGIDRSRWHMQRSVFYQGALKGIGIS